MGTWCSQVAQQAPDPTSKSCSVDTCRSGVQYGMPMSHTMKISLSPHSNLIFSMIPFVFYISNIALLMNRANHFINYFFN